MTGANYKPFELWNLFSLYYDVLYTKQDQFPNKIVCKSQTTWVHYIIK